MPNRKSRKSSKSGGRSGRGAPGPTTSTMEVSQILTGTLSSFMASYAVNPAAYASVSTFAEGFEFYRVTSLKYRLHKGVGQTGIVNACYMPGVTDTPPATFAIGAGVANNVSIPPSNTVPSDWRTIRGLALKSELSWYKTVVGTPDPLEEIQGNLFLSGSVTSDPYMLEVKIVFQFRGVVPISVTPLYEGGPMVSRRLTPAERGQLIVKKERDRMLCVLNMGSPTDSRPLPTRAVPVKAGSCPQQ